LNYVSKDQLEPAVDELVIGALYNASMEVYGMGKYRSVTFAPDLTAIKIVLNILRGVEYWIIFHLLRYDPLPKNDLPCIKKHTWKHSNPVQN